MSNAKTPLESEEDPVVARAAEWLVARDRGLSDRDWIEFERWKHANRRHAAVYEEMEEAWSIMAAAPAPQPATVPGVTQKRRALWWISAAAAAAAAVAFGYFGRWQPPDASYAAVAMTEVGGNRQMDLPDGSVIQLNTDTALEVQYGSGERRVKLLRGEAHFTVAKNAARPFLVLAGGVDVRAVGTAFNVRLRDDSVDVIVTEGRVRLERPSEIQSGQGVTVPAASPLALLTAGEQVSVPLARSEQAVQLNVTVQPVAPDLVTQTLAWRERQLQFSAQTLAEMVAEFNRYNRHQIEIEDPRLAAMQFGGTFPSDDCAGFVQLLEKEFGVRAEERNGRTVLRLVR